MRPNLYQRARAAVKGLLRGHDRRRPGDTAQTRYGDPHVAPERGWLKIVAGAACALFVLLSGAAGYFFSSRLTPGTNGSNVLRRVAPVSAPHLAASRSYIYMRQIVYYRTTYPVGTIIVDRPQTFLYVVRPRLAAMRYTIDVESDCSKLVGLFHVVRKEEWPLANTPAGHTAEMTAKGRQPARALELDKNYRIHGAAAPPASAHALTRCIALANDDMVKLYDGTPVGNRVVVSAQ